MSERYYEAEHHEAYARLRRRGLMHWSDLHNAEPSAFDDFDGRAFVERVFPERGDGQRVLEYGCGTGAAACHLAARGYRMTAVDLVPDAIAMARGFAAERGVEVTFEVQDVCQWPNTQQRFDCVLDVFCLQSIVTDADRARVLDAVRQRLEPDGRYFLCTAMFGPERDYGDDLRDAETGVVWALTDRPGVDARLIDGRWYLPNRRHLTAEGLKAELESHGLRVVDQQGDLGGEVVAVRSDRRA